MSEVDILIVGGTVIDGTGSDPRATDLAITAGRISALIPPGAPRPAARHVLPVDGLTVAPGFIDVHTHSDVSLLIDGRAESKIHQGVTTDVIGNCGFSAHPIMDARRREHLDLLAGLGDDEWPVDWNDLSGFADALAARGSAINVVPLVGHGQLRIAAAGMAERLDTTASQALHRLLAEALDQGAHGMSTGLTYVPSSYADPAELGALCRQLAAANRLYATHARGEGAASINEALQLARTTGAAVQYSHAAINDPHHWGEADRLVELFTRGRAAGADIAYDVYPYAASASALTQYLPAWVQAGGVSAMKARLGDAGTFRRARADLDAGWGGGMPWLWDRIVLSRTDGLRGLPDGASLAAAAASLGCDEGELVLDLCRRGGNRVQVVLFYRIEQDVATFLKEDIGLIGSDGAALPYDLAGRSAHPRAFGTHVRVLGRYVREQRDITLPSAIRRMTGAAADRFGLRDRGYLRRGHAADIVVFDADTVGDTATFADPARRPVGVHHVLVNGHIAVRGGRQGNLRHGQVLRAT